MIFRKSCILGESGADAVTITLTFPPSAYFVFLNTNESHRL